jgi:ATP-dependent DNA helicase DinG
LSKTAAITIRKFFSKRGPLAEAHPNYEYRKGQLQMAEAVEEALAEKRHLIVEAGTGTGKTLAYLLPALLSGKRVVVSTGTKNLQEQLFFKDIPFLERFFPGGIRACYMKGRANYACRQKIYDAEREPILAGLDEVTDFQIIRDWETTTETGDRAEIRDLPESSTAWAKVDARGEMCTGQKCLQFERCFITKMRQKAMESDLIIVNHHLFFSDLAVREDEYSSILPDYAAVIFDEAHELEDVAGQYFGATLSNLQVQDLARDILGVTKRKDIKTGELDRILTAMLDHAEFFFALFQGLEGRTGYTNQAEILETHGEKYHLFLNSLDLAGTALQLIQGAPEELVPLHRRTVEMADRLKFWMESNDPTYVYWVERRGRGCYLQATPIDVSRLLSQKLFENVNCAVLTSATLAVGGTFDYLKSRLGLENPRELIVPSHFDYETQALLYVPQHLPDVRSVEFVPAAAREILEILEHSRGRAFVLFTSYAQMRTIHERIAGDIGYPVLLQGTKPQRALVEEFRKTPHCVLFATSSFWQGVDVQGDQLSCVIIDKLPFAVPSDPIVAARSRAIEQAGGKPFFDYQVPQAAIALKQGFGRLIRSKSDRGVLVLLDNRITRQRYGQVFFDSLPGYRFTTELGEVESFFEDV